MPQTLMSVRLFVNIRGRILFKNINRTLRQHQRPVNVLAISQTHCDVRADVRQILLVLHVGQALQNLHRLAHIIHCLHEMFTAQSRQADILRQAAVAVHAEIFSAHASNARVVVRPS